MSPLKPLNNKPTDYQQIMKENLLKSYKNYSDEELMKILESDPGKFTTEAKAAAKETLESRGITVDFEINIEETSTRKKSEKSKTNYKPLIIGIILLAFNFYAANVIYQYEIAGRMEPEWLVHYLSKMGIFHDILMRAIVIMGIVYYRMKQKGKYLALWIIAGALLGAWVLAVVGMIEIATDFSDEKFRDNQPVAEA